MEPQLTIKEVVHDDLPAIQLLLRETFSLISEKTYPAEVVEHAHGYYTLDRLERKLFGPHSLALGAYLGEELVGCAWGSLYEDGVLSVEWAIVHSELIGTGVFSRLIMQLENHCREKGAYKVFLYASMKNVPAIRRYQKLGYEIEGVHRNHFFGWDFVSLGKVLNRKNQEGAITTQPDAI